jgi:hypothetical protein
MNKRGDERLLSIYLFVIYIIVAIGVVSGVLIFYGSPLDVRVVEAGVLNDRIIDCLVPQGNLNNDFLKDNFSLIDFCNFDFKDNTKKFAGDEQYAVKIELFNFDSCLKDGSNGKIKCNESEQIKELTAGKISFLEFCFAQGEKIPQCSKKELYLLSNEKGVLLRIISAVGKVENAQ